MIKYLVVPIDKSSVSFCYYDAPYREHNPEPVPEETLKRAVNYARDNGLTINFLYGNTEPPLSHQSIIESVSHAKIVPLSLAGTYPESIVVIESGEIEQASDFGLGTGRNIILRMSNVDIPRLATTLPLLFGTFLRLNLCLTGLEKITETELEDYGRQLLSVTETTANRYRRNDLFELSFLSDRIILENMRNCEAGNDHCTVGPDGRLYLCPGFLYDNPELSIGNLTDGIKIKNPELLLLDHAPVCSVCDAYHCKRCIYLNKKLTLEINTPSSQQCIASHRERKATGKLLELLRDLPAFSKSIPELDYLDPFVILDQLKEMSMALPSKLEDKEPDVRSTRDILIRILEVQEEILNLIRKK